MTFKLHIISLFILRKVLSVKLKKFISVKMVIGHIQLFQISAELSEGTHVR